MTVHLREYFEFSTLFVMGFLGVSLQMVSVLAVILRINILEKIWTV